MSAARKWSECTRGSQKQDAQGNETEATRKPRASFVDMLASAGRQAHPTAWPGFAQETHPVRRSKFLRGSGTLLWLGLAGIASFLASVAAPSATLETSAIRFQLAPETGSYSILDKSAGVTWRSNPFHHRFGEVNLKVDGKPLSCPLGACEVKETREAIEATFRPHPNQPSAQLRVRTRLLPDQRTLEFAYEADPKLEVESLRLLDDALWVTDAGQGYVAVPVRLGMLIPADSGLSFTQRFDTFAYEGCHMAMLGMVQNGAAALVTWHDPYVAADIKSTVTQAP